METWRDDDFKENVDDFFCTKQSQQTQPGNFAGLHYQIRQPQGKLVRVISGEMFDVAVDLMQTFPTFVRWTGATLSAENKSLLWDPPGFDHGFYVVSNEAEFTYKFTDYYAPENERCIIFNDASILVDWPIRSGISPILYPKDAAGLTLANAEVFK